MCITFLQISTSDQQTR